MPETATATATSASMHVPVRTVAELPVRGCGAMTRPPIVPQHCCPMHIVSAPPLRVVPQIHPSNPRLLLPVHGPPPRMNPSVQVVRLQHDGGAGREHQRRRSGRSCPHRSSIMPMPLQWPLPSHRLGGQALRRRRSGRAGRGRCGSSGREPQQPGGPTPGPRASPRPLQRRRGPRRPPRAPGGGQQGPPRCWAPRRNCPSCRGHGRPASGQTRPRPPGAEPATDLPPPGPPLGPCGPRPSLPQDVPRCLLP
mmetsp:Transcript_24799/g.63086  ORF Transcript_24799/g.63086 Transcript_24799/m.63086 type:complete len:251 (+) Transcript_24799:335-1087(+)